MKTFLEYLSEAAGSDTMDHKIWQYFGQTKDAMTKILGERRIYNRNGLLRTPKGGHEWWFQDYDATTAVYAYGFLGEKEPGVRPPFIWTEVVLSTGKTGRKKIWSINVDYPFIGQSDIKDIGVRNKSNFVELYKYFHNEKNAFNIDMLRVEYIQLLATLERKVPFCR